MSGTRSQRLLIAVLVTLVAGAARAQQMQAIAPAEGEAVALLRPRIAFRGVIPRELRDRVRLRLSGTDLSEFLRFEADVVQVICPLPLVPGAHRAELGLLSDAGASRVLAAVSFQVVPPGSRLLADVKLKGEARLEAADDGVDTVTLAPSTSGRLAGAEGSLAHQASFLHPLRLSGPQEDLTPPSLIVEYQRDGLYAAGGSLSALRTLEGAHLLASDSHRHAVEARLPLGRLGSLSLFSNLLDALPSAAGEDSGRSWLAGLAWRVPVPGQRVKLTLLGMRSRPRERDQDDPAPAEASFSIRERALLAGALLDIELAGSRRLGIEIARAEREVEEGASTTERDDWGVLVSATTPVAGQKLLLGLASVGEGFRNPASPGLASDRREARLELSGRRGRFSYEGKAALGRSGLEAGSPRADEQRYGLTLRGRLPAELDLRLLLDRQSVDGSDAELVQSRGQLFLARAAARWKGDVAIGWSELERDDRSTIARSLKAALQHQLEGGLLLRAGAGLERRREPGREGRQGSLLFESRFEPPGTGVVLGAVLSRATRETPGGASSEQLSGRTSIGCSLPLRWLGATLAIDAGWTQDRDRRSGKRRRDARLGFQVGIAPEHALGPR